MNCPQEIHDSCRCAPKPKKSRIGPNNNPGSRELWRHLEEVSREVESWPAWKRSIDHGGKE